MKILSCANAKKKTKRFLDFKFRSFVGCFQMTSRESKSSSPFYDGSERVKVHCMMAVKGLKSIVWLMVR